MESPQDTVPWKLHCYEWELHKNTPSVEKSESATSISSSCSQNMP